MLVAGVRIVLSGFDPAGRTCVKEPLEAAASALGLALFELPAGVSEAPGLVVANDPDAPAVERLRAEWPDAYLVVVSGSRDDEPLVHEFASAGADEQWSATRPPSARDAVRVLLQSQSRQRAAAIAQQRTLALRAAFDNARQAFLVLDRSGVVIERNAAADRWAKETLGRGLQPGERVFEALDGPRREHFRERFDRVLGGESLAVVREYESSGETAWYEVRYEPFIGADGTVDGVLVSSIDISERKRAERAADARERELRAIVDYTHDWESWIGPDGRLIWVSSAVERLTGYAPEECLLIPEYPLPLVHPDDRERLRAILADESETRGHDESFRLVRRDGGVFWGSVSWQPVFNPQGHALGRRFSIRDITARIESEQASQVASDRLQTLFDHAVLGIFQAGIDGRLLAVNQTLARILGYGSTASMMAAVQNVGDDVYARPGVSAAMLDAVREQYGSGRFETELRRTDGRSVTVSINLRLVCDERGRELYLEGFVDDITERKRDEEARRELENRVQQVQKLESLSLLAGGVAHDFNNLLMVILGNASLALMEMGEQDPARVSVQHIEQSARRAAELTNQMLAYSGGGRFLLQPLDVSAIVEDMQPLIAASLPKNAILLYELGGGVPQVRADDSQLRQVVLNLLTNAAEALEGAPGTITVRTGVMDADRRYLSRTYLDENLPAGRYVFVEVRDTGGGMDEQTLARLFEPFYTTKFTGRGLGLAAVLGIVRAHRGAIRVDSFAGHGSTFRILLPVEPVRVIPVERIAMQGPATVASSAPRLRDTVLVVDDDALVRHVTRSMLEKAGYIVETAADGVEALQLYEAHPAGFALVLLDLTMPRMDGPATFERIRQLRPEALVVLSTGYSEEQANERFSGSGLAGFIQKPYRPDQLLEKLRAVLAG